jgi:hypothetical protein
MSELTQFDPQAFQKRVKDHIVNSFGAMLPEDQFAAMVDKQITEFFETKVQLSLKEVQTYPSRYDLSVQMTPFQQMVWNTLVPMVKERLDAHLKDDDKCQINSMLDQLFALPEVGNLEVMTTQKLLMAMAGQFFANALNNVGYQAKQSVANAFASANMPDVAGKIMSQPNMVF